MIGQGMCGIGVLVRRTPNGGWEILGQEMVECGSFVQRKRSGRWMMFCSGMGGNGAFVRSGLRKLYRLSENTL